MGGKERSTTQKALNVWGLILIVWALYRGLKLGLPEWLDEFVAKPLIFILPVYIYIKRFEKRDFFSGISLKAKNFAGDFFLSLIIGVLFAAVVISAKYLNTGKFTIFMENPVYYVNLVGYLALALGTAFSEEVLSRGFILKRLYEESKNVLTSSFFASILFFFLHIPILFTRPNFSGELLILSMVNEIILSLAVSFIFLQRRSLTAPILIHAFYNLSLYFFI